MGARGHPANKKLATELRKRLAGCGPTGSGTLTLKRLRKGLASIRNHPEIIVSGEMAQALSGVGPYLAGQIDLYLNEQPKAEQALDLMKKKQARTAHKVCFKGLPPDVYVPKAGTHVYSAARVISELYGQGNEGFEMELLFARAYSYGLSRTQMTGALRRLAENGILSKYSSGYRVLPKGRQLCQHIHRQIAADTVTQQSFTVGTPVELIEDSPATPHVEITLVCDTREAEVNRELSFMGVEFHTRVLPVGDFCWKIEMPGKTYAAPWIVERKTYDDLVESIRSDRFRSQLERSQRFFQKVIYLIEGNYSVFNGQVSTFESIVSKLVLRGGKIRVFFTESPKQSANLIQDLTLRLKLLSRQMIIGQPFWDGKKLFRWRQLADANPSSRFTVRDVLASMIAAIEGVSPAKAAEVAIIYGSFPALHRAMISAGLDFCSEMVGTRTSRKIHRALIGG